MSLNVGFREPSVEIEARQYGGLLRRYLGPQLPLVVTLGVLLFLSLGLQLVLPQIIRYFIDEAQKGAPVEALAVAAVAFMAIAVLQQVVQVVATYFSERVGWTATNNIREDLAAHALSLDMSYHNDRTPGEMIERVDGDPNELGSFFSLFIFEMLGSLLLLIGILVLLLREDWRAGLALTAFVVAGMLCSRASATSPCRTGRPTGPRVRTRSASWKSVFPGPRISARTTPSPTSCAASTS